MKTVSITTLLFALTLMLGCGDGPEKVTKKESPLDWAAASTLNDRGVLLMDHGKIGEAIPVFEELARRTPATLYAPRFNLAVALLNSQNNDRKVRQAELARSEEILRALTREKPDRVEAHYTLGILLEHLGREREEIKKAFEQSRRLAPHSAECAYRLGKFLFEEGGENLTRAEVELGAALQLDPQLSSAWNMYFGTARRLGMKERAEEAMRLFRLYSDSRPEPGRLLNIVYNAMGEFACCIRRLERFDAPSDPEPASIVLELDGEAVIEHALAKEAPALSPGADSGLLAEIFAHPPALHDLDGDGSPEVFLPFGSGRARLFGRAKEGFEDLGERWKLPALEGVFGGVFADVDHDARPDLMIHGPAGSRLFLNREGGFVEFPLSATGFSPAVAAQIGDLDDDGDLDLVDAGFHVEDGASARILSNLRPTIYEPGDKPETAFREQAGVFPEALPSVDAMVAYDFDRDGDLDILLGIAPAAKASADVPRITALLNDRLFRFRSVTVEAADDATAASLHGAFFAMDVDGDGRPELVTSDWSEKPTLRAIHHRGGGRFESLLLEGLDQVPAWSRPYPADLDNDGDPDLVFVAFDGRTMIARNDGGRFSLSAGPRLSAHGLAFHDFDGDGLLDAVFADPRDGRPRIAWNRTKGAGRGLEVALRGKREKGNAAMWSTRFGVGASLEVAAAGRRTTQDINSRNGTAAGAAGSTHVGLGAQERADSLRILWPDFVIQNEIDDGSRPLVIEEVNRKQSSCPVLFKPNGSGGFDFVTDFLGVGGLGFFMEPGGYAPPDRDETVRIGDLRPLGDHYELRVHEPMEEISYLDLLRLVAVDHVAGSEAQCDERLATAEPMPSGSPLIFGKSFLPVAARSDAGRDCLTELSDEDRIYQPDMALDPRFVGYLVREQAVEFDFDAAAIMAAKPASDAELWLFIDGFVEYPYSHVNYAAWEAGIRGRALSLDVRDESGAFTEVAAELGYPAGMTRCMATRIGEALPNGSGAFRLRSNLDIRMDRLRLAWARRPAEPMVHRRDFSEATLRFVGYPAEVSPDGREPLLYDYQQMTPDVGWKVMGGRYTAFGDVADLIRGSDDRMVVMGHGEEIVLRIPVAAFPPLTDGMTRTFFLETEGYCKDMDPYTAFPATVAPLPHKGLVDYPAGLDRALDDEAAPRDRVVPGILR